MNEQQIKAMELALEALENLMYWDNGKPDYDEAREAITALKEALAQPEQTNTRPYYTIDELNAWADEKEKQAWRNAAIRVGEELSSVGPDGYYEMNAWQWLDWAMENVKKAQPEQEPLEYWNAVEGWVKIDEVRQHFDSVGCGTIYKTPGDGRVPLTTAQRTGVNATTWRGLTDEEIEQVCVPLGAAMLSFTEVAQAIEAKLKEKNT